MQSYDVTVVGAGMVGLSLALALGQSDLNVAVLDTQKGDRALSEEPELRVSAINLASRQVFENLGVWESICAQRLQPYQHMQVWDQDSFAHIQFSHHQVQQPELGYIIENQAVLRSLWQQVERAENIHILAPCQIGKLVFGQQESFISLDQDRMLSSRLVVGADGANSLVRRQANMPITFWDYDHLAIVATIKTALPHQNTARQVFTPTGPLAFLPLSQANLCSIVWSQQNQTAERLLAMPKAEFSRTLSAEFDTRLGVCELASERVSYPLKMRYSRAWIKDRVALVGDAAHTIHPLAGQGANLGILDAAALAQTLLDLHGQGKDIGLAKNLAGYQRWRKTEAMKMIVAMEGFKRLFGGNHPLKKLIRDLGLSVTDKLPWVKQAIMQQAMGLEGELPALAKRPLKQEG